MRQAGIEVGNGQVKLKQVLVLQDICFELIVGDGHRQGLVRGARVSGALLGKGRGRVRLVLG